MEFKEAIAALLQAGTDIERPTDRCYVHVPTGKELMRTTTYLRGGEEFFMPAKWKGASMIGTDCDQIVRDFFVEKRTTLRSYNYDHVTQEAFDAMLQQLADLDSSLGEWEVFADRLFLYSLELGVAGEIDLLLVNWETEEVIIVDMKTVRSPQYMTPGSDKMKKYNKQLNIYRTMAEELMGGHPVKHLFILPIHVAYPPFGVCTSKAEFLPWMEVDQNDPLPGILDLWQKNMGMTPHEHFAKQKTDSEDFDAWQQEINSI